MGRAILDNVRAGGYAGRLYTVNPRARQIGGERCLASVRDLPEPADLAVIAVHGMRLVGPDCFGVAVPGIGLDATFAASPAQPGVTGLVMQSRGLGFAVVDHLSRLGAGQGGALPAAGPVSAQVALTCPFVNAGLAVCR